MGALFLSAPREKFYYEIFFMGLDESLIVSRENGAILEQMISITIINNAIWIAVANAMCSEPDRVCIDL